MYFCTEVKNSWFLLILLACRAVLRRAWNMYMCIYVIVSTLKDHKEAIPLPESLCVAFP